MHKRLTTTYLLLLISLAYIATDIYLPSLPSIAKDFGVNDNLVQMTLFSYLISFSITPLLFGPLSDHIGRKKVLLGGAFTILLATVFCLFSPNIYWLIFGRFIQGIGGGAMMISARASVADLFTGPALAKQMAFMTMCMPLVLAIAPTLGGLLQEAFNWQAVFLFLVGYMVIILLWITAYPESLKKLSHEKISTIFNKYQHHLKNKFLLLYGINFVMPSFGLFAYLTVSPFLFQEVLGLTPAEYGALSLYVGATIIVTGYLNLKLIHHFSLNQVMGFGACLIFLSGCLLLIFHELNITTTWSLLIPTLIYFTCLPLCLANGASKSLSMVHENFGTASALLTTWQFLIGSLSTLIFSIMSDETFFSLGICFAMVGAVSLINLLLASRIEKNNA